MSAAGTAPVRLVAGVGQTAQASAVLPLRGKIVAIDPGHLLGNYTHRKEIAKLVNAGGLRKPCNGIGAKTKSGYKESAFTMSVANNLKKRLESQGATVYLTRSVESEDLVVCVDARGNLPNKVHADVLVSIHADGTPSRFHGFFVIRPAYRKGITNDIYQPSRTLSKDVRAGLGSVGLPRANYFGGDGFDTRNDMGTLNLSNSPAVMVELGNMQNPTDAAHMKSASYRDQVYAAGLAKGVAAYLKR